VDNEIEKIEILDDLKKLDLFILHLQRLERERQLDMNER
jgi:hypothetical protein